MPLADSNERTKTPKSSANIHLSNPDIQLLRDSLENIIKLMEIPPEKNTYKILDIISGDSQAS